jgi:hypothetical protein
MDLCTIEGGLLRKKPCGEKSVTKCSNCEQALCIKHAVAQLSDSGGHTGTFMCAECDAANRQYRKTVAEQKAAHPTRRAPGAKPAAGAKAPPPAAAAAKTEPVDADGAIEYKPDPPKK